MLDQFGRQIDYLRISITDRCNFRCQYCMPREGIPLLARGEILSFEEIGRVVHAALDVGITKLRITGGEPLVRSGAVDFLARLHRVDGLERISLTTNGSLLQEHAAALASIGLRNLNVSLDSLDPAKYRKLTVHGDLATVLDGIDEAVRVGIENIKINVVAMRGINDDEVEALAGLTLSKPVHVRFIEYMPCGRWEKNELYVPATELLPSLEKLRNVSECAGPPGSGPSKYYRLDGALGSIGLITPVSQHFCGDCNRLRLTADGKLRPCLLSDEEVDIRAALRAGTDRSGLAEIVRSAILRKPVGHRASRKVVMSSIGG